MVNGTIVSMHDGYLFARVDGYPNNVFVHATAFPRGHREISGLQRGTALELDHIEQGDRGPRAKTARVAGQVIEEPAPAAAQDTDLRGYIARLRVDRGFGYIRTEPVGEYFFHKSDCRSLDFNALQEGQPVIFDAVNYGRGSRAINIGLY